MFRKILYGLIVFNAMAIAVVWYRFHAEEVPTPKAIATILNPAPESDELPNEAVIDSDGDGLIDVLEREIWGTDPFNVNTDGDQFADMIELNMAYDPNDPLPKKLKEEDYEKKRSAEMMLKEQLSEPSPDQKRYFTRKATGHDNQFEHDDGLFRFDYANNLAVKMIQGVYFLEDITNKKVVFQIFEREDSMDFDGGHYICVTAEQTVCFSRDDQNGAVANLDLFGRGDRILRENLAYISARSELDYDFNPERYDFFSRSEMLELALSLRFPEEDFSAYKANCFADVEISHPLSGYICYALQEGVVVGIEGSFYPESSVNLFGALKILFSVFDVEDLKCDEQALDAGIFDKMTKFHYAYPIIAKAMYEGLFDNLVDQKIWPNRNVYKGEALQITRNFLDWHSGKKIRNYSTAPVSGQAGSILFSSNQPIHPFLEKEKKELSKTLPVIKMLVNGNEIYRPERGSVYVHLLTLKDEKITSASGTWDDRKLVTELEVILQNGEKKYFETGYAEDQFVFLKNTYSEPALNDAKTKLADMGLLPNEAVPPMVNIVPELQLYLSRQDFLDLYMYRTSDQAYKGHLVMTYPDGKTVERSVLIKTRGNATRGYIKSSYTIEAFSDFEDNVAFEGDEFLKDNDEMKLRSFIDDETMLHEKLLYSAFSNLGHYAPDFFDATLSINGVPMGFYQITEPVKKPFFKRRELSIDHYYYALNLASEYNTNLKYYVNDEITLAQYKTKGDPEKLLELIRQLEEDEDDLMWSLDAQTIFDYAMLVFLTEASDSLTHNYYVYFDETTKKWSIFPWDADAAFKTIPRYSEEAFKEFTARHEGTFNNLIYYFFKHLEKVEWDFYINQFNKKWENSVHLIAQIEDYEEKYAPYYEYENALWNGKQLERRKTVFNTLEAIRELKSVAENLYF